MIICTTVGIEPSELCYETCVLAGKCEALKEWERNQERRKEDEQVD